MSDYEYEDDEQEDYEFEYSDDDQGEHDVDVENTYYNAKGLKEDDPDAALAEFAKVVELESERGDWGFKALKQSIKLLIKIGGREEEMIMKYKQLLTYTQGDVSANVAEKGINTVLDAVSAAATASAAAAPLSPTPTPDLPTPPSSSSSSAGPGGGESQQQQHDQQQKQQEEHHQQRGALLESLQRVYETTLESLHHTKNDRLWFKTNLKLGHLLFRVGDYGRLYRVIKELKRSIENPHGASTVVDTAEQAAAAAATSAAASAAVPPGGSMSVTLSSAMEAANLPPPSSFGDEDGSDTIKRGTQLLEVLALQIQVASALRDDRTLRDLYQRALKVTSGIPHPRTLGIILECGGKMHMRERDWESARTTFFQSFKSYDEAGDPRRTTILNYLVMSSMLTYDGPAGGNRNGTAAAQANKTGDGGGAGAGAGSTGGGEGAGGGTAAGGGASAAAGVKIDPFNSQEARPYKNDPEVVVMRNLVDAYHDNNVREFEKILRSGRGTRLLEDEFIRAYVGDLLQSIRTQALVKAVAPYTRVSLRRLSEDLNYIGEGEVERLLVECIWSGRVVGKIDQVGGFVVLAHGGSGGDTVVNLDCPSAWPGSIQMNLDRDSCSGNNNSSSLAVPHRLSPTMEAAVVPGGTVRRVAALEGWADGLRELYRAHSSQPAHLTPY